MCREFSIREANQGDYEGLCEIFAEGDSFHHKALPHVFREPDETARMDYISSIIRDENAALFVAESAGQIIGAIHIFVQEAKLPTMIPRRYAVIENLVVIPSFRHSGVGQLLVKSAHQWAMNKKVTQIE